jgi:hypothetical protein
MARHSVGIFLEFSISFLLVCINYTVSFYHGISYMHILYFDQVTPSIALYFPYAPLFVNSI